MKRAIRAFIVRLVHPLRRRTREADLAHELESHLQLHIDDNIRAGMPAAEARRAALVQLGGIDSAKEQVRDRLAIRALDHLARDVRLAVRQLRSGTSAAAVVMLAIAIGLTTAMFAVVDALLIRPIPFRDANRLAWITLFNEHGGRSSVSPAVLRTWREQRVFEAVEGVDRDTAVVDAGSGPAKRAVAYVSPHLFDMLGVRAVRGRLFDAAQHAAPNEGVISEDLWRAAFDADRAIIGRSFTFNRETLTVIGVLPSGVNFPAWNTQVWRPRDFDAASLPRNDWPEAHVRIARDIPLSDALRVATQTAHEADASTASLHAVRRPLVGAGMEQYYRSATPLLAGGVGLVFFALCANVSGLLLARFTARRQQFDLCSALGASRGRLLMQAFVEAATIAVLGSAAGVVLAQRLIGLAAAILPQAFLSQTLRPLQLDGTAIGVATFLGCLATLVTGVLPAWVSTRGARALTAGPARTSTDSRIGRLLTRALLIAEVTFACALLIGAGLLVRSFMNLTRMDLGFNPRGLMTTFVYLGGPRAQRGATVAAIGDELRSLPGVQQVVWSSGAPFTTGQTEFADYQTDTGRAPVPLEMQDFFVGSDLFSIYGISILRGRSFEPGEDVTHVIVGERVARALWPDGDPVGHALVGNGNSFRVVGVAKEPRRPLIGADTLHDWPTLYLPLAAEAIPGTATLRCGATCPAEGVVRQRLLPIAGIQGVEVRYLEDVYQQDLAQPRATALVSGIFAVVALLAAAGGLFSALYYAVSRRRREFGIRAALGASAAAIGRLVVLDSVTVLASGMLLGAVLAWLLAGALSSLEYGVTVRDPITWLVVLGALTAAGMAASWWPARAAMRIDPVMLLRDE